MVALLNSNQRALLTSVTLALLASQIPSCGNSAHSGSQPGSVGGTGNYATGATSTGHLNTGGQTTRGNSLSVDGTTLDAGGTSPSTGAAGSLGGESTTMGSAATGGRQVAGSTTTTGGNEAAGGGLAAGGALASIGGAASSSQYVVSLIQSSKNQASDIDQAEVTAMVSEAIAQAGGLDFIHDGQTVVLKPNLLTHLSGCWSGTATLPVTVNGVTTDWRVTKAVADLVRAKNPSGQILVMEGSNRNTTTAFAVLGYTSSNFGSSVDAFIALEGESGCSNHDQAGLVQKPGASGKQYWVNERYFNADIIISVGAMKTHNQAGTTGCVKNLGIGATPNAMYSASSNNADCTRNMSKSTAASYIDHSTAGLGTFVSDFYSVRPADFAVMDGLQGLQNGPCSATATDRMNMRLILAAKNAVALDTIEALVMSCDPTKVPYLTKAEGYGLGTTDSTKINVVGKQVADVKKSFKSGVSGICN